MFFWGMLMDYESLKSCFVLQTQVVIENMNASAAADFVSSQHFTYWGL